MRETKRPIHGSHSRHDILYRSSAPPARAARRLKAHPDSRLILTVVTFAELMVGLPDESALEVLAGRGPRLEIDFRVARTYGRIVRQLRSEGRMIGTNDAWIASIALEYQLPVLTRNTDEFSRVEGLVVEGY